VIDRYRPDVIINAIGRCGSPTIDFCETHQAETAYANTQIPIALAAATQKHGIRLIHIGSGCINYGPSPNCVNSIDVNSIDTGWKETDFSSPLSVYSKSKYAADLILSTMPHTTILRIRMPISSANHPRNLLNKLISYNKIVEEPNSMTFLNDFVRAVDWAITNNKTGIYNVVSNMPLTHSVLLDEYKKYVPTHVYEKIDVNALNKLTAATRSNCILDNRKIVSAGFEFTPTLANVHMTIKAFVENRNKDAS
jgi:dTDP-4-dehydrorhamnose reductase